MLSGKKKSGSEISMRNWDDWFRNCDRVQKDLASYEEVMWDFYALYHTKKDTQGVMDEYAQPHDAGFYKDFPQIPSGRKNMVVFGGIIGFVAGAAFKVVSNLLKHNANSGKDLVISGIIFAVIGVLAVILYFAAKRQSLASRMSSLEKTLEPAVGYIPPKYRNSIATGFLWDHYLNYEGTLTFDQAITDLDDWLSKLPLSDSRSIGKVIMEMFDVPYEHTGLDGDTAKEVADVNPDLYEVDTNDPALADPNLPEDIRSHTFAGLDNAEEKLDELIGLENVKSQIQKMKNRMAFEKSTGGSADKISGNHMCFLGAAGTGKTTVARILTSIFYDFGYIKQNKCVEVGGGYFRSQYIGQTAPRTQAIVNYAMGGVLFIDEAYLMLDQKGQSGGTGTEATGVILKAMEDHKNDFIVIFAGYEDDVNRLLASNEGFASRIKTKLYFDDFSTDQLMQIFDSMCLKAGKNGYALEPKARQMLKEEFEREKNSPGFGNARNVRNALDKIMDAHADHYMNHQIPESDVYTFTVSDVQNYVNLMEKQLEEDARNYMASKGIDSSIISFNELKSHTKDGSSDPDKDLDSLTGLDVVKDEIKQMKAQYEFYKGDKKKMEAEGHHMVFIGPPGTGKTTVAGIMTAYLYQMGIIRQNKYVDVNGSFFRGQYIGHTGKRTQAVVEYSRGMVLFIDEAYLLNSDGAGDFGAEALGVLLDAMEKYRKDFVVIFAGYDKEMQDMLNMNSGLRSRISQTFHFKSYTPHELALMMGRLSHKDKFKVEKEVWRPLQLYLRTRVIEPHFGNARFIRSFWEETKKQHIMNFASGKYDESYRYLITMQDVQDVMDMNLQAEPEETSEGE